MTTDVITTSSDRPLAEALEQMRAGKFHHLVVVDRGQVVGVMSARDREDGAITGTVGDVMHRHVVSTTPDATVREAANMLRGRSIGCLPVFDGDRLVGIVTTTDLLELIGRGVERPVGESTRWTQGRDLPYASKEK